VNDPKGFKGLCPTCGKEDRIVFNLGFEPLELPDGVVVAPARPYFNGKGY